LEYRDADRRKIHEMVLDIVPTKGHSAPGSFLDGITDAIIFLNDTATLQLDAYKKGDHMTLMSLLYPSVEKRDVAYGYGFRRMIALYTAECITAAAIPSSLEWFSIYVEKCIQIIKKEAVINEKFLKADKGK